ncbi:hypothetical protein ACQR09_09420 [Bradyrhizobium oligotrophicum]|uniref:hypothetical protein n=1 Tax=Bradyrhizobium oligotrophicum TaxID=44255 RepID=UPI003EC09DD6
MSFDDIVEPIGPGVRSQSMVAAPAQHSFEIALDQTAQPAAAQPASIEMRITPPASEDMSAKVLGELGRFYDRAQIWQASGSRSASNPAATPEIKEPVAKPNVAAPAVADGAVAAPVAFDVQQMTAMLGQAFAFAIETTLVSKASTESTRIFNTFLKGQ